MRVKILKEVTTSGYQVNTPGGAPVGDVAKNYNGLTAKKKDKKDSWVYKKQKRIRKPKVREYNHKPKPTWWSPGSSWDSILKDD